MKHQPESTPGVTVFRILAILSLLTLLLFIAGCASMFLFAAKPFEEYCYATTNLADYGQYFGTNDNGSVAKFIDSFFPDEIQRNFSDVIYSYRAEDFDIYGFEAYLEFRINDRNKFEQYIASLSGENTWKKFHFDDNYMEYTIADQLELSIHGEDGKLYDHPHIMEAEIGKILYSVTEQKIIYVAIGVYDGGGVTTEFLCKFFECFHIDPIEYAQSVVY